MGSYAQITECTVSGEPHFTNLECPENTSESTKLDIDVASKYITLDAITDSYKTKSISTARYKNFVLEGTIKIVSAYRINGTSWAGFFLRTNNQNGKHTVNPGYLAFIRQNGEIGVHGESIREQKMSGSSGSNRNTFKIVVENNNLKLSVNNELLINLDGLSTPGEFVSLNVGGAKAEFSIDNITNLQ